MVVKYTYCIYYISPLKSHIIAHRHLYLQSFKVEFNKHYENMGRKTICDRMFSKHLKETFQKCFKMMGMKTSCY